MILDVVEPLPESEPQHGIAPSVQEAHCLYSRGDIEAAEWELDRVLHRDPNDLAALLLLAVIEYNRDNTERSVLSSARRWLPQAHPPRVGLQGARVVHQGGRCRRGW